MRIVIVATVNLYSSLIAAGLFADDRWSVVGVIETRRVFPGARSIAVRLLRGRYSFSFFWFKVVETLVYRLLAWLGLAATPTLDAQARRCGAPVVSTRRINSEDTVRRLREWDPDLIVSVSASEPFGRRLIAIPRLGAINVHASELPRHRGLAPYFWALHAGDRSTAVTVHRIDRGLDTGPILGQRPVAIEPRDSAHDVFLRCSLAAADELRDAVAAIGEGRAEARPQQTGGSYHSWPSPKDVEAFRARGHSFWDPLGFIRAVRST